MGKKKVIQKSKEELIKENESVEKAVSHQSGGSSKQKFSEGRIYIQSTYNNTFITVTDKNGNVIAWMSAGSLGFSGPKKATPFAASKVAEAITQKIEKSGPSTVEIYLRGVGSGRDSAVRSFAAKGFTITAIKDVTPIPHNGPKPPKVRRV